MSELLTKKAIADRLGESWHMIDKILKNVEPARFKKGYPLFNLEHARAILSKHKSMPQKCPDGFLNINDLSAHLKMSRRLLPKILKAKDAIKPDGYYRHPCNDVLVPYYNPQRVKAWLSGEEASDQYSDNDNDDADVDYKPSLSAQWEIPHHTEKELMSCRVFNQTNNSIFYALRGRNNAHI